MRSDTRGRIRTSVRRGCSARRSRLSAVAGGLLVVLLALTSLPGIAAPGDVGPLVEGNPPPGSTKCIDAEADRATEVDVDEAHFSMGSGLLTVAASNGGTVFIGDTNQVRILSGSTLVRIAGKVDDAPVPSGSALAEEMLVSGIGLNPAGSSLYVVDNLSAFRVLKVDLVSGGFPVQTLTSAPRDSGGALGVAVDGQNRVFVAQPSQNRVGLVSGGGIVPFATQGLNRPRSVAVDAAGQRLFVADESGTVKEFDGQTGAPKASPEVSFATAASPSSVRVAVDAAGELLFAGSHHTGEIWQLHLESGTKQAYAGPSTANGSIYANGLSVAGADSALRLYFADVTTCVIGRGVPLDKPAPPTSTTPTSSPGTTTPTNNSNTNLTIPPGNTATNPDPSGSGNTSGVGNTSGDGSQATSGLNSGTGGTAPQGGTDGVNGGLADTGGRLTADDLVNQLLGGRSDGAFSGSQAIVQPDVAVLGLSRGEFFAGADVGGLAGQQAASANVPPGPPPGVVATPGSLATAGPIVGAPAPPPVQAPGAPPLAQGQLHASPGFGGASTDPAEGAPRYAMVRNESDGTGAAAVLVSLLVLGGCSLLFTLGVARGGRGGPGQANSRATRPAPARAWAR